MTFDQRDDGLRPGLFLNHSVVLLDKKLCKKICKKSARCTMGMNEPTY